MGDSDALARVYAARLLAPHDPPACLETLSSTAAHPDPLVRQETYDALGDQRYIDGAAILVSAIAAESDHSAARTGRLALQRLEFSREDAREQQLALLQNQDEHERAQTVAYMLRRDKALGLSAMGLLALEPTDSGMLYLLRLLMMFFLDPETANSQGTATAEKALAARMEGDAFLKHNTPTHAALAMASTERYNRRNPAATVSTTALAAFVEGNLAEDLGPQPINHAYNPLTGRGFIGLRNPGGPAIRHAEAIINNLAEMTVEEDLTLERRLEAWRLMGAAHHVFQDMSSPLHVFNVWHVLRGCKFEWHWHARQSEIQDILAASPELGESLSAIADNALHRLDEDTRQRLNHRLQAFEETPLDLLLALAWCAYYVASFPGEVRFCDGATAIETLPASYDDGAVGEEDNVLNRMFDGNIRYHASWWSDYFIITDLWGNNFVWNKLLVMDDWRPCPNPFGARLRDGHVRNRALVDRQKVLTVSGRFFFTQKGDNTPHCRPVVYPNGAPMDQHLIRYYGEALFPLTAAYGALWLEAMARRHPQLFQDNAALQTFKSVKAPLRAILDCLSGENDALFSLPILPAPPGTTRKTPSLQNALKPRCGCARDIDPFLF